MHSKFALGAALVALCGAHDVHAREAKPRDTQGKSAEDIVVTANPFGRGKDDTATISAKVSNQQLLKQGGASIADALANVPGMASTGFASGSSRPIIRGMDANRVRLLEDGVSSADVSDIGPDHGVPLDPLAARSVEVIRGAGTLRYGSQAIGGVVNAINNRVPTTLSEKSFAGELTGSFGTNGDVRQGSALADISVGELAIHADAFGRKSDNYDTPRGRQPNSFFRGHGEAVGASWFPGGGESHFGAGLSQYRAKYGIPSDTSFIDLKQTKFLTKSAIVFEDGPFKRLNLDGGYAKYLHSERARIGTVNATFKNRESDARAELILNPLGPLEDIAFGFEHQRRKFSALGEASSYLYPTLTRTVAGYIFLGGGITDQLKFEASGRVERVRVRGTPLNGTLTHREFTPMSGAVGLLYQPIEAVKLGLTYANTARAPAITELFARGAHDGSATYETGNAFLKTERARSIEASMRVRTGPFTLDASVFSNRFSNYIYGDLTGNRCDEEGTCAPDSTDDLRELVYRQQSAHFRGAEGEATMLLTRRGDGKLVSRIFADRTRATFANRTNVPRIPPYRIGGGLDWTSARLDIGTSLTYVAKQNRFGAFDSPTRSYVSLGASIGWRPFVARPGIEFLITGQNLTNSVQRNAAALNKDRVIMAGRNIRFVVKIANF